MTGPASASTKAGGRPARDRSRSPRGPLASHESPHITPLSFHTHSLLAAGAASWHQAPGTWILAPGTWHRATFGTGGGRFFLAPEDGAVPVRARSCGRLQNAPPHGGRQRISRNRRRKSHPRTRGRHRSKWAQTLTQEIQPWATARRISFLHHTRSLRLPSGSGSSSPTVPRPWAHRIVLP